jgi:hypothetical protein
MPVDIVVEHLALAGIRMEHGLDMPGLEMVVVESMRLHSNLLKRGIVIEVSSW